MNTTTTAETVLTPGLVNAILTRRKRKCVAQGSHAPVAVTVVDGDVQTTVIRCERCGM
jgi:hypothetical protein